MDLGLIIVAGLLAWLYAKSRAGGDAADQTATPVSPAPTTPASGFDPWSDLAVAWAHAEGWDQPNSLARRNANPVNIKGNWPGQVGSTPQGFAVFSDEAYGFDAAESYLQQQAETHPDWTLRNLFAKVLGNPSGQPVNNDQGNSDQEAQNVANYLGIPVDDTLANYMGGY
jgi:hypothetical protein